MSTDFQGLRRAAEVIAGHRDYPGKQDLVREGLDDIDGLYHQGRLTTEEKERLRSILLSATDRTRLPEEVAPRLAR